MLVCYSLAWELGNIAKTVAEKFWIFGKIICIKQDMDFPQVGGSEEAFLAAKSLFLSMGKSTIYCGGAGSGSVSNKVKIGIELLVLLVAYIQWVILLCLWFLLLGSKNL
jgi:hypothetical protein